MLAENGAGTCGEHLIVSTSPCRSSDRRVCSMTRVLAASSWKTEEIGRSLLGMLFAAAWRVTVDLRAERAPLTKASPYSNCSAREFDSPDAAISTKGGVYVINLKECRNAKAIPTRHNASNPVRCRIAASRPERNNGLEDRVTSEVSCDSPR